MDKNNKENIVKVIQEIECSLEKPAIREDEIKQLEMKIDKIILAMKPTKFFKRLS